MRLLGTKLPILCTVQSVSIFKSIRVRGDNKITNQLVVYGKAERGFQFDVRWAFSSYSYNLIFVTSHGRGHQCSNSCVVAGSWSINHSACTLSLALIHCSEKRLSDSPGPERNEFVRLEFKSVSFENKVDY